MLSKNLKLTDAGPEKHITRINEHIETATQAFLVQGPDLNKYSRIDHDTLEESLNDDSIENDIVFDIQHINIDKSHVELTPLVKPTYTIKQTPHIKPTSSKSHGVKTFICKTF